MLVFFETCYSNKMKKYKMRKLPSQRRSLETYEYILLGAAKVIEKFGMSGFNTNKIAQISGVSVGSIYQYFPSKESILVELIEYYFKAQDDLIISELEKMDLDSTPPFEVIEKVIEILLEKMEGQPQISRQLLANAETLKLKKMIEDLDENLIKKIYSLLQSSQIAKKITPLKLEFMLSAFKGMNDHYIRNKRRISKSEFKQSATQLLYGLISPELYKEEIP